MSQLLLLREYSELCDGGLCRDLLDESYKQDIVDNDAMYLTGVLQRADTRNQNSKIYPRRVLEREIENYQKLVKEGRAIGTLDHESKPEISLALASHLVKKIWWDGDAVMGTLKVLSTEAGKTLRSLINDGVKVGISSRALGTLNETTAGNIVEDDLQLLCFDVCSEPSTPGAFLHPQVLKESRETYIKQIFTRSDRLYRQLGDILS